NMTIWQNYGVNSWPTLWLIDPEGYLVGWMSGEARSESLEKIIDDLITKHRRKRTLKEAPIHFAAAEFDHRKDRLLCFPGNVLDDLATKRLFIADSTHHRIVVTDLAGNKLAIVGTGEPGHADGPFSQATFNDPQGMALAGGTLFVADRKNHLIRTVDFKG